VSFLLLWHVENRTLGPVFFRLVVWRFAMAVAAALGGLRRSA
jgi:hypothetical protein